MTRLPGPSTFRALRSLLWAGALASLCSGCSLFSPRPTLRTLELAFSDPTVTMPYAVRVLVVTRAPDGTEHEANGQIDRGGTIRSLCESLRRSLANDGCDASYRDLDPESDGEGPDARLRRSMRQVVQLPADWQFVSARSARPEGGTGGSLVFTMRGAR